MVAVFPSNELLKAVVKNSYAPSEFDDLILDAVVLFVVSRIKLALHSLGVG